MRKHRRKKNGARVWEEIWGCLRKMLREKLEGKIFFRARDSRLFAPTVVAVAAVEAKAYNFSKKISSVATLAMAKKEVKRVMEKASFKMAAGKRKRKFSYVVSTKFPFVKIILSD